MNEKMILKQAPIISFQLNEISNEIKLKIEMLNLSELEANEENVKELKAVRADLNKDKKNYEDARIKLKKAVLSPYDVFETEYKDKILTLFLDSDNIIKNKVEEVEGLLRQNKVETIKAYFEELKLASEISFVSFDQVGLNITLSASLKSLKDQSQDFINTIKQDLEVISEQENKERIFVKYKKTLNLSKSIIEVAEEIKALQEINEIKETIDEEKEVATIIKAPKIEEMLTTSFTLTATKEQLIKIRSFIQSLGVAINGN